MTPVERRGELRDRRAAPRGGRRPYDQPGRFPNVIVADSYEGVRIPCVKYLDRCSFAVDEASNAAELIAKLAARQAHAVLLEAGLPDGPVARIVDLMRRDASLRPVPLIVMTSELEAGAEGLDGIPLLSVLAKPFSLSSMVQEIRRLLREQPPIRAAVAPC